MEEKVIERLLEIDRKAQEVQRKREEGLRSLEENYKNKIRELIEKYEREIEESSKKAFNEAVEKGEREAEGIRRDTEKILNNLEEVFSEVKDEIEREFFLRIFKVKR